MKNLLLAGIVCLMPLCGKAASPLLTVLAPPMAGADVEAMQDGFIGCHPANAVPSSLRESGVRFMAEPGKLRPPSLATSVGITIEPTGTENEPVQNGAGYLVAGGFYPLTHPLRWSDAVHIIGVGQDVFYALTPPVESVTLEFAEGAKAAIAALDVRSKGFVSSRLGRSHSKSGVWFVESKDQMSLTCYRSDTAQ